jgi:hypothetical protein
MYREFFGGNLGSIKKTHYENLEKKPNNHKKNVVLF